MRRFRQLVFFSTAAMGLACASAHADGHLTGQLQARTVLYSSCGVSVGGTQGAAGTDFGQLNFGTQSSSFTGTVVADASGSAGGAAQIACSPDITAFNVSVDGGSNPGRGSQVGTGSRAMRSGNSYLPYEVFSDAAMTVPYGTAGAQSIALPASGAVVTLPVYGRIHKTSASALPSGTYADVLSVTLSW